MSSNLSFVLLIIFVCLLIITAITVFVRKFKSNNEPEEPEQPIINNNNVTINVDLPDDFDEKKFEEEVKDKYKKMQYYFSNIDYDNLSKILDEELYKLFEIQMHSLENNNKRYIRENIEFIDFKINDYTNVNDKLSYSVSIGVYEDKYTKYLNDDNFRRMSYENYYELELLSVNDNLIISKLKLLYSHSKKMK